MRLQALFVLFIVLQCYCDPMEDLYTDDANVAIRWARLHFEIMRRSDYSLTPPVAGRALSILQK